MKHEDVLALLNEPACAHNKKSKSGCAAPQPGATQGGCCFDGARNALAADRGCRPHRTRPDRLRRRPGTIAAPVPAAPTPTASA